MLYIDHEPCIDYWACLAECPVNAIFPKEDVPGKWEGFIELNAELAPLCPSITEKKES